MKISDYKKHNSKYRINKIKERKSKFLTYNSNSEFTIFDKDLEQILNISVSEFIDIDFIPEKEQVLYSTGKSVTIIDYNKSVIKTIEIENAEIHIQNEYLWLASIIDEYFVEVTLHNVSDFNKIASVKIKLNYYASSTSLFSALTSLKAILHFLMVVANPLFDK